MSSFQKKIVMAAVLSMASAIKLQSRVTSLRRWQNDQIFSECDQSIYLPGGVYEMRLQCNNQFVIKKHEGGKVFDLKYMNIESPGVVDHMQMTHDGNLIAFNMDEQPMWSALPTNSDNSGAYLDFQDDGNLVIYQDRDNGERDAIWDSATDVGRQDYQYQWSHGDILLQCKEGENILYQHEYGHPNKQEKYYLWADCLGKRLQLMEQGYTTQHEKDFDNKVTVHHTSQKLDRAQAVPGHLVMQSDGNLVFYGTKQEVMWASDTAGNPGAFAQFEDDGNLVIYKHAPGGKQKIWEFGTNRSTI